MFSNESAWIFPVPQRVEVVSRNDILNAYSLGFPDNGNTAISMASLDRICKVGPGPFVIVEAGARVEHVVEELKAHNLTLQNFASIAQQQIGGFIQVSAHGTGVTIPPVDEQVVGFEIITPAFGKFWVNPGDELFDVARVGLGALGVISRVKLRCVERHLLEERSWIASRAQVRDNHIQWLWNYQHLRYMWIPDTDVVVVVACNPVGDRPHEVTPVMDFSAQPFIDLLASRMGDDVSKFTDKSFSDLRALALEMDPLNKEHVALVNKAEAEFWTLKAKIQPFRYGYSDEILGFECGGRQWVSEVAFPVASGDSLKDIDFMEELLNIIDDENIPAHAPIEQRWTSTSSSVLSPANGESGYICWVGIINYLPDVPGDGDKDITEAFTKYRKSCERRMWSSFGAVEHWAKTEIPGDIEDLELLRQRVRSRYNVDRFNSARQRLDPHGIFSNEFVHKIFD